MGITFKRFAECVPYVISIKKPILLRGKHGIGKSQVVYDFANEIGMPVIERRASQMTEGDLLGLPKAKSRKGCTVWLPPEWLKTACDTPVVLFLDEVDRAVTEVRQGLFELTDSRKIAGNTLHENTIVFAAVNGGDNSSLYQVGEMDPAELDRWVVFDIEPDVEEWLEWAKENRIFYIITDFIRQFPQHLEHKDSFEPNKVYPSRRSWVRLSDSIIKDNLVEPGKTSSLLFNLTNAYCGQEAAFAFQDFVKQYKNSMTAEDILEKDKWKDTMGFGINEQIVLLEKIEATECFKRDLTDTEINNLTNWFLILPSEIAMKFWSVLGEGNFNNSTRMYEIRPDTYDYVIKLIKSDINKEENKNENE